MVEEKHHTVTIDMNDLENLVTQQMGYRASLKSVTINRTGSLEDGTYREEIVNIIFNLSE